MPRGATNVAMRQDGEGPEERAILLGSVQAVSRRKVVHTRNPKRAIALVCATLTMTVLVVSMPKVVTQRLAADAAERLVHAAEVAAAQSRQVAESLLQRAPNASAAVILVAKEVAARATAMIEAGMRPGSERHDRARLHRNETRHVSKLPRPLEHLLSPVATDAPARPSAPSRSPGPSASESAAPPSPVIFNRPSPTNASKEDIAAIAAPSQPMSGQKSPTLRDLTSNATNKTIQV